MTRRPTIRALSAMLGMCALIRLSAGAGQAAAGVGAGVGGRTVYRMCIEEDARTLDPPDIVDAYSWGVARRIYNTLIRLEPDATLKPDLAESWQVSADGCAYTFALAKGARFHNGREIVADDVVYSLTRLARKSRRAWIVSPIQGAQDVAEGKATAIRGLGAPDAHTVSIRLDKPFPPLLHHLSMVNCAVVPRETVEADEKAFSLRPVGSGPFRLKEWRAKDRFVLERFDGYFRGPARLTGIEIRIRHELAVSYEAYLAGEIDHCVLPPEHIAREAQGPRKAELRVVPNADTRYLGVTMTRQPLGVNVALRRALNYAINRDFLCNKILGGSQRPAKGVLPPGIPGYDPALAGYGYSPEKARAELAAAGFGDKNPPPPITLWYHSARNGQQVAEQIQADLRRIGVTLRLRAVDFAGLLAATEAGSPDLFRIAWVADYPDPDNFLYVLFHSKQTPSEGNRTHLADAEVDGLLDEARGQTDTQKRLDLYRKAERAIVDKAPWVFLSHGVTHVLVKPCVRGMTLGPLDAGSSLNGVDFHGVWLEP